MTKYLIAFLLLNLIYFSLNLPPSVKPAFAQETPPEEILSLPQPIQTKSEFSTKLETETIKIERDIKTQDDPDSEVGEEKVLQEGVDGKLTKVWKITFHLNEEYERELISSETQQPQAKLIAKGTKIVWRTLQSAEGEISYWRKLRVWATHYDSHCPGCNDWTAIGMRAGKGVIAVDPKVIKLRSQVYIPGYGKAIAGDTGGAIKGNIIDLGFADAKTAGWHAQFVDIYLIN